MTKEEIISELYDIETEYGFNSADITSIINKIYKDFDNRTCINCKHCIITKEEDNFDINQCNLEVEEYESFGVGLVEDDFGCNKWEPKC